MTLVQLHVQHIGEPQLTELLRNDTIQNIEMVNERWALDRWRNFTSQTSLAIEQYGQVVLEKITTLLEAIVWLTNSTTGPDISMDADALDENNAPIGLLDACLYTRSDSKALYVDNESVNNRERFR